MVRGWTYDKFRSQPYAAQITIEGRNVRIGNFDTPEEAHAAYVMMRELYPRLPRSGGKKAGYSHERKLCDLCGYDWSIHKFDMHRKACERRYNK